MLLPVRRLLLAVVLLIAGVSGVGAAETLSAAQQAKAWQWAANNALFVVYHETAHLLFDQLRLPVLGKEEDAADAMASFTLLEQHTHLSDVVIADAAYGWLLSSKMYGEDFDDSDFYNPHSLDRQRAFQIVCFMIGSDKNAFRRIADDYKMDHERQDSCSYDYQLVKRSLEGVLGPYWRKTKKGVDVAISYNSASGSLRTAADEFKKSGVFETVAKELDTSYALRNKVSFLAKRCGEPNAFYDAEAVQIIFCYELMDDFVAMISDDMPEEKGPQRIVPEPTGLGRTVSADVF